MTRLIGDIERVSPEYSRMLAEAVESAGLRRQDLKGRGTGKQTTWRVLDHVGAPSIAAAERIRKKIHQLRPDLNLPPPAVAVAGVDHYEWLRIGTELHAMDAEDFRKVLAQVRAVYERLK